MHQLIPVSHLSTKDIVEFTTIASYYNKKQPDLDYTICMFTTMQNLSETILSNLTTLSSK